MSAALMFDWARGSMWRRMVEAGLPHADLASETPAYLKHWALPWYLGAVEFRPGLSVLDVGSAAGIFARHIRDTYGCSMHVLDVPATDHGFGIRGEHAGIEIHHGFAGDDVLPAESFDIVYCNSVIEHTYDRTEAVDPGNPLPHLNVIRDLCRMVKPGGLLLLNWDTYLCGVPHHQGWEYEADIWAMHRCGMRLADPRRKVRPAHYLFNHPDSLFFAAEAVRSFAATLLPRGTSINSIWVKPGAPLVTRLFPVTELVTDYLPVEECGAPWPEVEAGDIDGRFKALIDKARQALGPGLPPIAPPVSAAAPSRRRWFWRR